MIDVVNVVRRSDRKRRLLMTTALVSMVTFVGAAMPARADYVIQPSAGTTWAADSAIWLNEATNEVGALPSGATGVLTGPSAAIAVQGIVTPGAIAVASNGFALTGDGTISAGDSEMTFSSVTGTERSLSVSAGLGEGAFALRNGIQLTYSGTATEGMTAIAVDTASSLVSTGLTRGTMTVEGNDTVQGEATLYGASHVGDLANSGAVVLQSQSTVTGNVTNTTTGTISVNGVAIKGTLDNTTNEVTGGDLTNRGALVLTGSDGTQLTVDGRLTNSGTIEKTSNGDLVIRAGQILLTNAAGVEDGISFLGTEVNQSQLDFNGDQSSRKDLVEGGLLNEEGGVIDVTATFERSNYGVTNEATFNIRNGGVAREVSSFQNGASGRLLIEDGGRLTAHVRNLGNLQSSGNLNGNLTQGGVAILSGRIGGQLTNDSGQTTILDDLSVRLLINNSTLTIGSDITLTSSPTRASRNVGTLTVEGTVESNVINSGSLTTATTGTIDGYVQNDGTLTHAGTITGRLVNNGTATLSGSIGGLLHNRSAASGVITVVDDLTAGDVENSGTLTIVADQTLKSNNEVENLGTLNVDGTLDSNLKNSGTTTVNGSIEGEVANVEDGTLTNSGTIAGDVQNTEEATLINGGTIAGNVDNTGEATLTNSGTVEGDVTNAEDAIFNNTGTITGKVTNDGKANLAGTIDGRLDNDGEAELTGRLAVEDIVDNDGTLTLDGTDNLVTDEVTNDGTLALKGGTITGAVANRDQVDILGDASVVGNLINNEGATITGVGGPRVLSVSGDFFNNGTINVRESGKLSIYAGTVRLGESSDIDASDVSLEGDVVNGGTLRYRSDATLMDNLTNARTGEVIVSGSLDGKSFDISNAGEFLVTDDSNSSGVVSAVDSFTNTGVLTIEEGTSLQATTTRNVDGGTIPDAGTIKVAGTLTTALTNDSGTTTSLEGGRIVGNVANAGTIEGRGHVEGVLTNLASGSVTTGGDLQVTRLINNGSVQIDDGDVLTADNGLDNRKDVRVEGTLAGNLSATRGATTVLAGGTIAGAVTNAGTLRGDGSITGTLDNSGAATLEGDLASVTNSGTLTTDGNLTVDGLVNTGTTTISDNDTLASATAVDSQKSLNIAGTLNAGLTTGASADTVLDDGRIVGAVSNAGTLRGSGRLDGRVTNTGRVEVAEDDAMTAVAGVSNDGTVAVTGLLTGDVTNNAAGTTTLSGGQIAGSLTNAGKFTGRGRVTGAVVNSGNFETGGNLAVQGLSNTGTASIGAGHRLTSADRVQNSNNLRIAGTLDGSLRTGVDGTTTLAGGTILGPTSNDGTMTGSGTLQGPLDNNGLLAVTEGQTLVARSTIGNDGRVELAGTVDGDVLNRATGTVILQGGVLDGALDNRGTVSGAGTVSSLDNRGTVTVAANDRLASSGDVINRNDLAVAGTLAANLVNVEDGTTTLSGGSISGTVRNDGLLTGTGTLSDTLDNRGTARLAGQAAGVVNSGDLAATGRLSVTGLTNSGTVTVGKDRLLASDSTVENRATLALSGTLDADLSNAADGTTTLSGGRVDGTVLSLGTLRGNGTITGLVENRGQMRFAGSLANLANEGSFAATGDLSVAGRIENRVGEDGVATFTVAEGADVSVANGTLNGEGARFTVAGTLRGGVDNLGTYAQTGRLNGSLVTRGAADLDGRITGNVTFADGSLTLRNGLRIDGMLDLRSDLGVGAGDQINAGSTVVRSGTTLSLAGAVNGTLVADGGSTIAVTGTQARANGGLVNNGTLDLTDNDTGTVLRTRGLAGDGTVLMDINSENLASDRVVVDGGRTTGALRFSFTNLGDGTVGTVGQSVTILDVDETFNDQNDFTYTFDDIPASSERIVYSIDQIGGSGDLTLVSQVNPAIGALFANVTLVQSLIGSVINRPSSPYVTGLAVDPGDKPCGVGGWGRATGGYANVSGTTDNQVSRVQNNVDSKFYGMQGGVDLACFNGATTGWTTAVGVLAGVNYGSTTQPIYSINGSNSQTTTGQLSSITTTDFQQIYGGVYATASKDRWQADIQLRYETTDFELKNDVVGNSPGLGLDQTDFSSDAITLSGAVSYTLPVAKTGWSFTPTAGFAYSRLSTDGLDFSGGYKLEFEDSERKVAFIGGTMSKTFVQTANNSALQAFATATYYKDFADQPKSTLSNPVDPTFTTQSLTSDNLEAYSEVSIGANYVKVLNPGRAGRPRQFSTSARIDGRLGDSIDSVGVTAQMRWQF